MPDIDPVIAALKARRLALGLSQSSVAAGMGCQGASRQSRIADLEAGRSDVRLATLRRWCDALGVEPAVVVNPAWES